MKFMLLTLKNGSAVVVDIKRVVSFEEISSGAEPEGGTLVVLDVLHKGEPLVYAVKERFGAVMDKMGLS